MSDTEDVNIADTIISNVTPSCMIYEFVRYQLQGANDYMNVSYIQHSNSSNSHTNNECCRTQCGLCETVLLHGPWRGDEVQRETLEKHVHTLRHETRFLQLKHLQKRHVRFLRNKRLQRSGKLRKRSNRLGLTQWRWHVNHLIMEYIDAPLPETPTTIPTPEERQWNVAAYQLAKYEQMERMSLLELAIRKIGSDSDSDQKNKTMNSTMSIKEEDKKIIVKEPSVKNGASIIIPLILDFLGKPTPLPLLL